MPPARPPRRRRSRPRSRLILRRQPRHHKARALLTHDCCRAHWGDSPSTLSGVLWGDQLASAPQLGHLPDSHLAISSPSVREPAGHAFISYVREDSDRVDELQQALETVGVRVWRDRADLWPGDDWRRVIRGAITNNALVFIACFSSHSAARKRSYQNEELTVAIEQFRLRPPGARWLIPVRFDDCLLPPFSLGADRTLDSIQRADLFGDRREVEMGRLITTVQLLLEEHPRDQGAKAESKPRPQPTTSRPGRQSTQHGDDVAQPGAPATRRRGQDGILRHGYDPNPAPPSPDRRDESVTRSPTHFGVEVLTEDDWRKLRDIRLYALVDDSQAFLSSYDTETRFDEERWRREFVRGEWNVMVADGTQYVGLAGVTREPGMSSQECYLEYLWVGRSFRRRGVASMLLRTVLDRLRDSGVDTVWLYILDGDQVAMRLFQRFGFQGTNERQWLPHHPAGSEERMRLRLS